MRMTKVLCLILFVCLITTLAFANKRPEQAEPKKEAQKMKILVHVTQGPENPTRAALAFLIAKTAIEEGHTVTLFLAGDAVQLMRDGVLDNLTGLGTGNAKG